MRKMKENICETHTHTQRLSKDEQVLGEAEAEEDEATTTAALDQRKDEQAPSRRRRHVIELSSASNVHGEEEEID